MGKGLVHFSKIDKWPIAHEKMLNIMSHGNADLNHRLPLYTHQHCYYQRGKGHGGDVEKMEC